MTPVKIIQEHYTITLNEPDNITPEEMKIIEAALSVIKTVCDSRVALNRQEKRDADVESNR